MVALRSGKAIRNVILGVYSPRREGRRWLLIDAVPLVRPGERTPYLVYSTFTDITRRKRAEDALRRVAADREQLLTREREARERVTTILESITDAFLAVDRAWRVTYFNARARDLIRTLAREDVGDLIGRSLWEAFPSLADTPIGRAHQRAMATQTAVHFEYYLASWDRWLEINDYPSPRGLAVSFRDCTERKRVEEERERALERERQAHAEAAAAVRFRDDMLSVVSHDLRNPLSTITMASSFLLETIPRRDDRAQERQQLEVMLRSARTMNRLIEDLLDIARIESGRMVVDRRPLDMRRVVDEAVMMLRPIAERDGIGLECHVSPSLPRICADRERLLQIFSNLVGNAVRYTPGGGRITLSVERDGDGVRCRVTDTGRGIPPEALPHLFDRFWHVQRTDRQGLGLGLAIVHRLVRAHDGAISVSSQPGRGTTFTFTLPAGPAHCGSKRASDAA
jgi:signal transduction histidine kinase